MCASKESVRDIMLGAQEIGVLNTGQYAFINLGNIFILFSLINTSKIRLTKNQKKH